MNVELAERVLTLPVFRELVEAREAAADREVATDLQGVLLTIFAARGDTPSSDGRKMLAACSDLEILIDWLRRAAGGECSAEILRQVGRSVLEETGREAAKAGMTFLDTYKAEGRTEGRAEMLLELLEAKFTTVPDDLRQRVAAGTVSELQTWGTKFVKAKKIEDVFRQRRRTIFR